MRVTVENVSKRFIVNGKNEEEVIAVDGVSLKISSGGAVAILGPSGSGKTTLLRIIAGLDDPDSGTVYYDDEELSLIRHEDRGIGMVFQSWALIPHWKAERSVGFFLKLRKREQEVPERVRMVSNMTGVNIGHLMDKFPKHLSGGEKQRVAIARAFARDLRLLLFDEPFANLDAKFRDNARVELRRLIDRFKATMIYVTHDQMEAMVLADRIILMNEGHIEQVGTYFHLYDNPTNRFVAEFIGTPKINLFEGHISGGQWHGQLFERIPINVEIADGVQVTMGIRPEYLLLNQGPIIPAKIESITPFFSERYLLLEIKIGRELYQMKADFEESLSVGHTIQIGFDPEDALFFDTETGKRFT